METHGIPSMGKDGLNETPNPQPYEDENIKDVDEDLYVSHVQPQPKQRKLMLSKYTIYVTSQRMYIVGSNNRETMFRVLEIDLTQPNDHGLSIIEDNVFFTRNEIMKVLSGLEESSEGGLTKKLTLLGLLGFIRFTQNWYLSVITKRSVVSILGGHYLYHIDDTELIPVCNNYKKPDRNSEETRYLTTFANLDLTKTFYYSYTYDLTNSLQKNFINNKKKSVGPHEHINFDYNEMFVWNSFLFKPIFAASFDRVYDWFQPIIHGFIDQAKISVFDAKIYITIIARRSHHFAGARFLKRGVNDQGNVANEVETEQIVHDLLTSSFHDPTGGFYNNPRYTSYIQHRGSIPLSWSQEIGSNIKLQTKPPITINVVDPYYSAAALHFDGLFKRYGSPVLILNLIKQREKTPRESKLLNMFDECITYLNKFLIDKNKLNYTAWDMSRASKNRGQDVIEYLEHYADETLQTTGFFHNGLNLKQTKLQQGVCRTNCIDCLDRTNAAQFVIGKRALGYQLQALGIVDDKYLKYDSDVVNILTEMFHDHGDTIALQYGGSHLVNTMETYRKINQWTSHSRDLIESIKRFYSNSFVDAQRQEAINLFLGNYVWEKGLPMLWDLNTDYYLHHDFVGSNLKYKPSYTHWFTDSHLIDFNKSILKFLLKNNPIELSNDLILQKYQSYPNFYENYFIEMYVPRVYTSLQNAFEFKMNSTLRYVSNSIPKNSNKNLSSHRSKIKENNENDEDIDLGNSLNFLTSPFETRKPQLINSKLKNFETITSIPIECKKENLLEKITTTNFTERDEFNVLKLQIAQLFENFEDEYIYYPLNLKGFLNEVTPKIISKAVENDVGFPVFVNSLNNNTKTTTDVSDITGFYNFNLDLATHESNKNFSSSILQDGRNLNDLNERLDDYVKVAIIPKVMPSDKMKYVDTLNFINCLPIHSNDDSKFEDDENRFDYNSTRVSLEDYEIYTVCYKLSNLGNDVDFNFQMGTSPLIVNDNLKDNYFATSSDVDVDDYNESILSPTSFGHVPFRGEMSTDDDDDDDVADTSDENGHHNHPQDDDITDDDNDVASLDYAVTVTNINNGNSSNNDLTGATNAETEYDQFPNIQDDDNDNEDELSLDYKLKLNPDQYPEEEEDADDDDDDNMVNNTVIHDEARQDRLEFKNDEITDGLV